RALLDPPAQGQGDEIRAHWVVRRRGRQPAEPGEGRLGGAVIQELEGSSGVRVPGNGGQRGEQRQRRGGHGQYSALGRAWPAGRARASSRRRSRRSVNARPVASQSLGNMLMDVNPGMVLISFTSTRPLDLSTKKSTLA